MVHGLKIAPNYFEKVVSKEKTFEVRYNDRNFQVGDILKLGSIYDITRKCIDFPIMM